MKIPEHTLIHYVRDNKGSPRGVLVAVNVDNNIRISWSYCRKTDRFTKEMALHIAIGRAMICEVVRPEPACLPYGPIPMPHQVARELEQFTTRCKRYYKLDN